MVWTMGDERILSTHASLALRLLALLLPR